MGCLYTGCSVSIRDGVLVNGMGCSYTQDEVLVFLLEC